MPFIDKHQPGICEPEDVEEMSKELERGDRPGESQSERENRAFNIMHRKVFDQAGE